MAFCKREYCSYMQWNLCIAIVAVLQTCIASHLCKTAKLLWAIVQPSHGCFAWFASKCPPSSVTLSLGLFLSLWTLSFHCTVFPLHFSRNYQSNQNINLLICHFQYESNNCDVYVLCEFSHACRYTRNIYYIYTLHDQRGELKKHTRQAAIFFQLQKYKLCKS